MDRGADTDRKRAVDLDGDRAGRSASRLLQATRRDTRHGESVRRISAGHDTGDGLGEREVGRDLGDARDWGFASSYHRADRPRGRRHQSDRRRVRFGDRARHSALSQQHSVRFPRVADGDRFLSLPAGGGLVGVGIVDAEWNRSGDLPSLSRGIVTDLRNAAARGNRVSETPIVSLREVRRDYALGAERVHALQGVSIDVDGGDYVAIVGPSGCGKSTLLNLIGVIDQPTSGTVTIDGRRVDSMSDAEATRF